MEGRSPGIWIAAAIILAVIVVAISVPNPSPAPAQPSSAPGKDIAAPDTAAKPVEARPVAPAPGGVPPAVTAPPVAGPTLAPDLAKPPPAPPVPDEAASGPPASRAEGTRAVDNVHFALRDFRAALGGNPVGTNAEITRALLGDNTKQMRLDLPDGSRVSRDGELCDPWGTPYFFHQLSAQKMEVRSAGPDRQMWTSDDIQM